MADVIWLTNKKDVLQWLGNRSLCDYLFDFAPEGKIPISFFNVYGCVHNSQVAKFGEINKKLNSMFITEMECVLLPLHMENSTDSFQSNHLKIIMFWWHATFMHKKQYTNIESCNVNKTGSRTGAMGI